VATFTKLKSGSWRVQVRRKGKYVNDTFLRRKDAEEWALEIKRRIDRGEPPLATRQHKRCELRPGGRDVCHEVRELSLVQCVGRVYRL